MKSAITTHRPRLVILRALGLGDFLAGVPAYRALARAFPAHYRILAAPIALAPLAELCGAIDEVVDTAALMPLERNLAGADVAVNLHGRGPQSHRVLLETEPRRLFAFANDDVGEPHEAPRWDEDEHEVLRWCRMLEAFGIPADPTDLDLRVAARFGRYHGAILLHPGAASEARRWPVRSWIELARRLRARGYRVLLTGSEDEFRRARLIARNAEIPIDDVLAGRTNLDALACVVASARALVCGDTGIAHLATALGTPSVVLFGPVSPTRWGPPRERSAHRVIWHGGTGNPHGMAVDASLASIRVDEVMDELQALLATPRAG